MNAIAKLKKGYDSIYTYKQNVSIFIEESQTGQYETSFELALRESKESNALVGFFRDFKIQGGNNVTEKDLDGLRSPFKVTVNTDGLPVEIWTKKDESLYSKKIKASILKLTLQNATEIHDYLGRNQSSITDDKCQEVTTVSQNKNEYIFETKAKNLDCNGMSSLQGVSSDKSDYKVFYYLTKDDEKLQKVNSTINVVYLTTVAARFETVQTADFKLYDGLLTDIDESVLIENHTPDDIDKLYESSSKN